MLDMKVFIVCGGICCVVDVWGGWSVVCCFYFFNKELLIWVCEYWVYYVEWLIWENFLWKLVINCVLRVEVE